MFRQHPENRPPSEEKTGKGIFMRFGSPTVLSAKAGKAGVGRAWVGLDSHLLELSRTRSRPRILQLPAGLPQELAFGFGAWVRSSHGGQEAG